MKAPDAIEVKSLTVTLKLKGGKRATASFPFKGAHAWARSEEVDVPYFGIFGGFRCREQWNGLFSNRPDCEKDFQKWMVFSKSKGFYSTEEGQEVRIEDVRSMDKEYGTIQVPVHSDHIDTSLHGYQDRL